MLSPAQHRWRVLPRPSRPQNSPRAASCTGETTPPNRPSPPSQASPRPMEAEILASEIRNFHAQEPQSLMLTAYLHWPCMQASHAHDIGALAKEVCPLHPCIVCGPGVTYSSKARKGANGLREYLSQKVAFEALSDDIAVQRGRAQQKVQHRSIHDFLLLAWQRQAHPANSACQLQDYDAQA